jgi:Ca2+-binding EF-hand superfamily protein
VPHEACLTEEDSFCFQSLFEGLGHNGDSLMGIMKLSEGLRNWSSSIEMSSEKEILKAGDANSNSALDFEEFLQHLWDHEKKHGW